MHTMRSSPARVPGRRRPLDQVVAHADNEVGPPEKASRVVLRVQPGGEQEVLVVRVEHALAHEGRDHVQPRLPAELAQRRRRSLAHHPVARQQHRASEPAQMRAAATRSALVVGLACPACGVRCRQRHAGRRAGHHVGGQLQVRRPGLFGGRPPRRPCAPPRRRCADRGPGRSTWSFGCIISTVSMNWWVSLCMPRGGRPGR